MSSLPRSPRRLLPLVAACLLAACQPQADSATAAQADATPEPSASPASAAPSDASGELRQAFEKFLAAKSYRARMSDASGKIPATTMEFVAPDRYRIRMGTGMEQVRIGPDLYTTMGGKTMRTQAEAGTPSPRESTESTLKALEGATVEALGQDSVDGEAARVYRIVTTQPGPGETRVWIADGSGLPIKSEAKVEGVPATMLVQYSDFDDASIRIDPPKAD